MKDLSIALTNRPLALAELGEALGAAGVSLEGGGAFLANGVGVGHFLIADADVDRARASLARAEIELVSVRDVLVQRLHQERPGQLGALCRRMGEAGVNIEVLYSDHANQLILVVDDIERGRAVSVQWEVERQRGA